jgi:hypothetical protein
MPPAERIVRNERGMALALAIFALVVMGGLVASNFFAGMLEQQSGRNVLFAFQAGEAAEGELWQALRVPAASALLSLPVGGARLDLGSTRYSGVLVERNVVRLTDNLFLVQSRGTRQDAAGGLLATRALGLLAKLAPDSSSGLEVLLPLEQRAWLQLY